MQRDRVLVDEMIEAAERICRVGRRRVVGAGGSEPRPSRRSVVEPQDRTGWTQTAR